MVLDLLTVVFFTTLWPTHGLFMAIIWTIIAFVVTMPLTTVLRSRKNNEELSVSSLISRDTLYTSLVIGLVVFSHWVLDLIGWPMKVLDPNNIGTPFLFDDAVNFGFGVYSTWVGALTMDIGVFVAGLALYIYYLKKIKSIKNSG